MIGDVLPWILSAITIWMTILAGNKYRHAWAVGLVNQALWLVWIVITGTWGLIPMNVALWIVYTRNHLKWSDDVDLKEQTMLKVWLTMLREKLDAGMVDAVKHELDIALDRIEGDQNEKLGRTSVPVPGENPFTGDVSPQRSDHQLRRNEETNG